MSRVILLRLLLLVAFQPALAGGADRWAQIKAGMSSADTVKMLGEPLVRSQGKGFELWIYDRGAEVVFYGDIIAWTAPAGSAAPASANESWAFFQAAPDQIALPFPKPRTFLPVPELASIRTDSATKFRYVPKS